MSQGRGLRRLAILALLAVPIVAGLLAAFDYGRRHPENMPWTALDLNRPIGAFTGRKLAALRDEPDRCRELLADAGVAVTALPPRDGGPQCGYDDAVRLEPGGDRITLRPAGAGFSCAVAAAFALWEREIVQPAAARHFGSRVAQIEHLGGYSCRRIGGGEESNWSEHATANAIDIAAFRLADGRRISLLDDWGGTPEAAAFLREVRDGACRLYATVLSPDYDAAHRDHLHFDQAARGARGWRGCS